MLEKGTVVYFLMNGYVMTGKVFDISGNNDNYEFSIEGYAGCAGPHIISSSQIHLTVFLSQEEAEKYKAVLEFGGRRGHWRRRGNMVSRRWRRYVRGGVLPGRSGL